MPDSPAARGNEIKNIWAVGRNYADHAKELGNVVPKATGEPMIFLKAGSSIVTGEFRLPQFSQNIHFECEIALQFGDDLEFSAITIALDLTARDLQDRLKAQGHPWTLAKSFRASCPLGPLMKLPAGLDLKNVGFTFKVDGNLRQTGNTSDMIFSAQALRSYILERFPVVPGDLLLTGTPAGVAELKAGSHLEAEILGLLKTSWQVHP